jgi:Flp pilus assembly protein TadD
MAEDIYPIPLRLGNGIWSYARYLVLTVWPAKLAVIYPYYGAVLGTKLPPAGVLIGVACLVAVTAVSVVLWRRGHRAVLIGWLWFVGTLIPVIGLVQVGWQSMADRYTYIPHMGLFVAIVWGVAAMLPQRPAVRRGALGVACVIAITFSIITTRQLSYWRDSVTLFNRAVEVTDHNPMAQAGLADALAEAGDHGGAIAHYSEQFQLNPSHPQPLYNIGRLLALDGKYSEAQAYYERALAIEPEYADALLNVAHAVGMQGRHAEAVALYERGLRLKPDAARARFFLGLELVELGRAADAHQRWLRAREIARAQDDQALVDEIEAQLSRPPATQSADFKPPALPIPPQTTENRPH